jgi:tryptophanyl-tRNA synthetase
MSKSVDTAEYIYSLEKKIEQLKAEAKMGNIPYAEAIELKRENETLAAKVDYYYFECIRLQGEAREAKDKRNSLDYEWRAKFRKKFEDFQEEQETAFNEFLDLQGGE